MQSEHFPTEPGAPVPAPMVYVREKLAWEYKQVLRDLSREAALSEAELNELGTGGWEMAGVFTRGDAVVYYFKRLKE